MRLPVQSGTIVQKNTEISLNDQGLKISMYCWDNLNCMGTNLGAIAYRQCKNSPNGKSWGYGCPYPDFKKD